jgi:putative flavoprotein involved in K+ transport
MEAVMMIDGYIQSHDLDAPPEALPDLRDGMQQPVIEELDLRAAGIRTIIWAMGYSFDYSLVKLPVQDENGFPIQKSGMTRFPGLHFAGMPWMPSERSGFLIGVGKATEKIAMRIAAPGPEINLSETRLRR